MSVSVWLCVCVCVCLSAILSSELHVRSSPNFLRMLPVAVYFRFMDNVIFAYKTRFLDVAAQLKRTAHAALGLAINCAQ